MSADKNKDAHHAAESHGKNKGAQAGAQAAGTPDAAAATAAPEKKAHVEHEPPTKTDAQLRVDFTRDLTQCIEEYNKVHHIEQKSQKSAPAKKGQLMELDDEPSQNKAHGQLSRCLSRLASYKIGQSVAKEFADKGTLTKAQIDVAKVISTDPKHRAFIESLYRKS